MVLRKETAMNENNDRLSAETPQGAKKGHSRKARILAWIGVAFMVFLVIMYSYSLATGAIFAF